MNHVTLLLKDKLHWHHASEYVAFELCLFNYQPLNGLSAPITSPSLSPNLPWITIVHVTISQSFHLLTSYHGNHLLWSSLVDSVMKANSIALFRSVSNLIQIDVYSSDFNFGLHHTHDAKKRKCVHALSFSVCISDWSWNVNYPCYGLY